MLSDFSGARDSNASGCLLGPWEVVGKESWGLERIYGYLCIHFESILGFTRNKQMGCLEGFRGNANGAKHTRHVTSHVSTPMNVLGENMSRLGEVNKMSQKQPKLRVIIHTFSFLGLEIRTPRDAS